MSPGARQLAAGALLLGLCSAAIACEPAPDSSRIIVAGGSLTEIIYFLGEGRRIVAVDSTSNFPEEAQRLPSIGYVRALSAEGLLSLDATLVLGEDDMQPPQTLAQVRRAGVDILKIPEVHTAQGIVDKVRCVASVLGLGEQAEAPIETKLRPVADALDELRTQVAEAPNKVRAALVLDMESGAPVAAGRGTSGHGFLGMILTENVFADLQGWKPVSLEVMAKAVPDVIVMSQRGASTMGSTEPAASHPLLRLVLSAEKNGRTGTSVTKANNAEPQLIVMDAMATLGYGPRTLIKAHGLAQRLHGTLPGGPTPGRPDD